MPINEYKDQIQHSLYGRKLGLDANGFAVGVPGVRIPTEISTAPSTMASYGMTAMTGSTGAFWTLGPPMAAGVEKIVINASSASTAVLGIVRSTALGDCSFLGSTSAGGIASTAPGVRITLTACGAAVRLVSVSSAVWAAIGYTGNITSSAFTYNVTTSS